MGRGRQLGVYTLTPMDPSDGAVGAGDLLTLAELESWMAVNQSPIKLCNSYMLRFHYNYQITDIPSKCK